MPSQTRSFASSNRPCFCSGRASSREGVTATGTATLRRRISGLRADLADLQAAIANRAGGPTLGELVAGDPVLEAMAAEYPELLEVDERELEALLAPFADGGQPVKRRAWP
jgi:hypothetical protein